MITTYLFVHGAVIWKVGQSMHKHTYVFAKYMSKWFGRQVKKERSINSYNKCISFLRLCKYVDKYVVIVVVVAIYYFM